MSESDNCAFHHATPASAQCSVCAKRVCGICTTTVNSHAYCSGCGVGLASQKSWLAALFSLVLPGTGQVYNGEWSKALLVFLLAPLVVPWLWGVVDAAGDAAKIAAGAKSAATVPTGVLLLGVKILWIPVAFAYGSIVLIGIMALAGFVAR